MSVPADGPDRPPPARSVAAVMEGETPKAAPSILSRRPVRREGAEGYLFVLLVSFAMTVIATRWFLELTGFPQIGGGELHIAHALWGGAAMAVAAVLPILLAGRLVYLASAALAGAGIGLFIDEVGKFITAENDYFYPAAAPIIYATFLLAVLIWLRARRDGEPDPRAQLLTALELLEESVDGDLQRAELEELRERLASAARRAPRPEQRRLAADLLAFVEAEEIGIAPDRVGRFDPWRERWRSRADRWLGGRGLRAVVVVALLLTGVGQILAVFGIGSEVELDFSQPMTSFQLLQLVHLVVEGVSGVLIVAGAVLVSLVGWHRLGWTLAYFGLLVLITLADLISFYVRQFDSILVALGHLALLIAVVATRDRLRAED
jgi:hypothetical protein